MDDVWQPQLFASGAPEFDPGLRSVTRRDLGGGAWIDYAAGWLHGANALFEELLESRIWAQRLRRLFDKEVVEPRLTAIWHLGRGKPLEPPVLEDIRSALSRHYGRIFDSVGFNLYRDGRDSVAWHRDRIRPEIENPIVALLSLGEPRRFRLRPRGGGRSLVYALGNGDLLVTGGTTQRTWEHCVPKVPAARPRISVAFRHGLDPTAYSDRTIADTGRP